MPQAFKVLDSCTHLVGRVTIAEKTRFSSVSFYQVQWEDARHELVPPRYRIYTCNRFTCLVFTCSKSKDQPGQVAKPARGQLNCKNVFSPAPVRA